MRLPIMCCGPCKSPPLGFATLPDSADQRRKDWAGFGYLCDDCAYTYMQACHAGDLQWGQPPTAEHMRKYPPPRAGG